MPLIPRILLLIFIFNSSVATAAFRFTDATLNAYREYLKLRLETGNKYLQTALAEQGKEVNGLAVYMENCGDLLSLMSEEDVELYKKLKDNEDIRLKKIRALDAGSPYYLFTQAEIKIQWGFVKLKFGDYVAAVRGFKQAYQMLAENEQKFPLFLSNKKSIGLLRVLFSSVPPRYQWVLNMIGVKGDLKKGMADLMEVGNSNDVFAREAQLIRILLQAYLLNEPEEAIVFAEQQFLKPGQNDLLQTFVMAVIYLKAHRAKSAVATLKTAPMGKEYIPLRFLHYLRGEANLLLGSYEAALDSYQSFLSGYRGKNHIKDSFYKIFLAYWMLNDPRAFAYLELIERRGTAGIEPDKYAQRFAQHKVLPARPLMEARLLTDGGEYQAALNLLAPFNEYSFASSRDKIEFFYRKGRIYHQVNNLAKAIFHYERTIALNGTGTEYFAPNAALQLGYIYRDHLNDMEKAKMYFELAIRYPEHEYKDSIDNKAKAALSTM